MDIIIALIIISLSIAVGFLGLFIWNVRSGQFEDTVTPSIRVILEDKGTDGGEETSRQNPDKTQGSG